MVYLKVLLHACLTLCLSIFLRSGSAWSYSSLPYSIIKSSRSVLQRLLHVFSTHLQSLEFLKILSFRNLKPSTINPGFPLFVTNFSMLAISITDILILWIELMYVPCVFNYSRKMYMYIPWRQLFKYRDNESYTTIF